MWMSFNVVPAALFSSHCDYGLSGLLAVIASMSRNASYRCLATAVRRYAGDSDRGCPPPSRRRRPPRSRPVRRRAFSVRSHRRIRKDVCVVLVFEHVFVVRPDRRTVHCGEVGGRRQERAVRTLNTRFKSPAPLSPMWYTMIRRILTDGRHEPRTCGTAPS